MLRYLPLALLLAVSMPMSADAADKAELASRYYEDALVRFQRKDDAGTIIQLKNALQQDPKMLPALMLLGQAHLRKGEPAAAERVFQDAEKLGIARGQIVTHYVQAFYDQGKYKLLLERFGADGLEPDARLEVLLYRARAQLELSQIDAALTSARQAQQIAGGAARALAVQARIYLNVGRVDEARNAAAQAIRMAPNDADALNMQASIAHATGDAAGALRDYGRALAAKPEYLEARVARAGLLLDLKRDAEAWADLEYLKKNHPFDARAAYLRSVYFSRKGDQPKARESLAEVAAILDAMSPEFLSSRPQLQLLGGLSHFGLNQFERAKTFLGNYIKMRPREAGARKVLGAIYLSERQYGPAIAMLELAHRAFPEDARVMAMLGAAHMGKGNHAKAAQLMEQAASAQDTPDIQTGLGMSLIGSGREEAGFNALARAYKQDPVRSQAGAALAMQHLKRGEPKQAIAIVQDMLKRNPGSPGLHNLLGIARLNDNDRAGARAAFNAALGVEPGFHPSSLNLGKLDEAEGKPDAARERYRHILGKQPSNVQAMMELAALEERAGRGGEALRWLDKARAAGPRDLRPLLALSDLHLRQNNPQKALEAAKDAQAAVPNSLTALMTLSRAQLATGNADAAKSSLRSMSQLAAFDAPWLTRIAALQLQSGDRESAGYSLEKALLNTPGYAPALNLKVQVDLQKGDLANAERKVNELLAGGGNNAEAQSLLGDVRMSQRRYADAVNAFRAAHARQKSALSLMKLYDAMMRSGDANGAARLMTEWVTAHPRDGVARHALGEAYMALRDWPRAKQVYQGLIAVDGKDARAHNNLANVLLELRDPGALTHAEQARALAPNVPQVNDTLGWVLVTQGQREKGLRYLREAALRAPDDPVIKQHLEQALSGKVAVANPAAASHAPIAASVPVAAGTSAVPRGPQVLAMVPVSASVSKTDNRSSAGTPAASLETVLKQRVTAWADAWSRRDVAAYLAFYSPDFKPSNGLSLTEWQSQRRERLAVARSIQVKVKNPAVEPLGSNKAKTRFTQHYASDRLNETTSKTLVWEMRPAGWQIVSEQ